MAVTTLLKLAGFTNELHYVDIAHQALAQMQPMMAQYPLGFGQWLQALAYALSKQSFSLRVPRLRQPAASHGAGRAAGATQAAMISFIGSWEEQATRLLHGDEPFH
jgi:uncharacterized protein YyaL (SSP411 family)